MPPSELDIQAALTEAQNRALVTELIRLNRERKAIYAAIDECYAKLLANGAQGATWLVEDKNEGHVRYELHDNFADSSVVFRPAGVRRWELREVKRKRSRACPESEPDQGPDQGPAPEPAPSE